jgi:hypothetical protein
MRQRFAIIITVALVVALLVALNAASYVGEEQLPDTEFDPDRSTYNAGSTGSRALYDLLAEGGRQVLRWREAPHGLLNLTGEAAPSTFVVIGDTRVPFDQDEAQSLLRWVERGGRLVVIDRRPDPRLLPRSEDWTISTNAQQLPRNVNPSKPEEMTAGVQPVRASQPSVLTRNVEAIQPSRFAGGINVTQESQPPPAAEASPSPGPSQTPAYEEDEDYEDYEGYDVPPPPPAPVPTPASDEIDYSKQRLTSPAPVAHFEGPQGALLIDYPHGAGRVVLLSDPYMVANGGILLADNLQLALNTVAGAPGVIAFDEYHQGRGATRNPVLAYFAGTPVLWMVAQVALVVLALLWTGGRRFARPLPVPAVDRRSSLEFVASMAELQERARAYDLAIENIYTRLRRVLVRQAGLGHNSPRMEIAERAAARSSGKLDAASLERLMRECEEAINSGVIDSRKSLELVTRLREVERVLGLRMRSRETRQAAEGLEQNTLL